RSLHVSVLFAGSYAVPLVFSTHETVDVQVRPLEIFAAIQYYNPDVYVVIRNFNSKQPFPPTNWLVYGLGARIISPQCN
ncbi:hypothetical protein BBP40_000715, partial [Aspergillus hancockii]